MFLEHGSFQLLELAIKKRSTLSNSRSKQGGRFTKLKLEKNEAYSKKLSISFNRKLGVNFMVIFQVEFIYPTDKKYTWQYSKDK